MNKSTEIKYLKGVGEKRAALLNKLGIFTLEDLLYYYPRDYLDLSRVTDILDAVCNETCCISATVCSEVKEHKVRNGLTLYKTTVTDGMMLMDIVIFNSKYSAQKLINGNEYIFYGKVTYNGRHKEMSSPQFFGAEDGKRLHSIYSLTAGVTNSLIEKLLYNAYSGQENYFTEFIPEKIRNELCLTEINTAVREMHFPTNYDTLSEAKRRLIFEELFVLSLSYATLKGNTKKISTVTIKKDYSEEFSAKLPFTLTSAQARAIRDCISSFLKGEIVNRLIQGDVGSGKTAVAASVIYTVIKNGYQCALMAPTEILAVQHFNTIKEFFKDEQFGIELLTGSVSVRNKKIIKERIADGSSMLIIGTHALIQDDVCFKNPGLVITDEQHRFGVRHRGALSEKGSCPHTLVMSATPIPRTLALIIYGDLDVSILDELPPGRQPVETYAIPSSKRLRAYSYIKKHLDEGRQAYIVCPMVEESDNDLAAAVKYSEELSNGFFSGYSVGLLHGKMKPKEKDRVMTDFLEKRIDILVSTTVIEVGVDVPNSVIMLIENAERFGLSQLHQLRGRIGRGKYKSTCILITDSQNESTQKRMNIMTETTDGFKIADEDLKMRGPGDFFGSRQHGLPELKVAMLTDTETLKEAGIYAKKTLINDPDLSTEENRLLKAAVDKLLNKAYSLN